MPTHPPPPIPVFKDQDGFTKIGDGPYVKWEVTTVGGQKVYTMWVKQNPADTPKEFHSV